MFRLASPVPPHSLPLVRMTTAPSPSRPPDPCTLQLWLNISYATATGDYFMNFKNATTGYAARLFARDYAGALQFGIASGSTGTMYGTTNFAYNTTYLVVAKHDLTTGASDVFVLDTCSFTEPAPLASATGTPLTPIVGIAIRQGTTATAATGTVDGIRVATNWASAATCTTAPPATLTIGKTAPATVEVNEAFDYTISVANDLGIALTDAVITDSLPLSATFQAATPGFELLPGNVISWTVPSIANSTTAVVTVTVTAPAAEVPCSTPITACRHPTGRHPQ